MSARLNFYKRIIIVGEDSIRDDYWGFLRGILGVYLDYGSHFIVGFSGDHRCRFAWSHMTGMDGTTSAKF